MIVIYVGGVGSGKTLSIVKEIVRRENPCFVNFDMEHHTATRLRWEHLIEKHDDGSKKGGMRVNYQYWNDISSKNPEGFDIYLDEFHNIMGSRRGMSKRNVLMSDWLSQVRKILGENERCNLYLLTQKLRRIDINSRDLAHVIVKCEKVVHEGVLIDTVVKAKDGSYEVRRLPLVVIYKYWFNDCEACQAFETLGIRSYYACTRFAANPYYRYYDSYRMVEMGSEEYV